MARADRAVTEEQSTQSSLLLYYRALVVCISLYFVVLKTSWRFFLRESSDSCERF